MLILVLAPGEYITIGEDIVVQYNCIKNDNVRLSVSAPRELPILRSEVRERQGKKAPDCVLDNRPFYRRDLPWNQNKAQALHNIRQRLNEMEQNEDTRYLKTQLEQIFPSAPSRAAGPHHPLALGG